MTMMVMKTMTNSVILHYRINPMIPAGGLPNECVHVARKHLTSMSPSSFSDSQFTMAGILGLYLPPPNNRFSARVNGMMEPYKC
jgi:hypothetical protein